MKTKLLTILIAGSLALPAFAQTSQPATKAATKTKVALKVQTTSMQVAMGLLMGLESEEELPQLGEGQHYVITLNTEQECEVKAADGKVAWMMATVHPGALMATYQEEIDMTLDMAKNQVVGAMAMFGISAKEAGVIFDGLVAFPKQIAALNVTVPKDMSTGPKGKSLTISLSGVQGSWLDKVIAATKPSPNGAPVLETKDSVMEMRGAMSTEGMGELMKPVYNVVASLGTGGKKKAREKNLGMFMKYVNGMDGSFAATGDPFGPDMMTLSGVRDAAGVKALIGSEEWAKMTEDQASIIPMADVEAEANALTHRDVKVSRISIEMDSPISPNQTTYSGVAGNYMVTYQGEKADGVKKLIDMVLDQKVKRSPIAGGALFTMSLAFDKLMDQLSQVMPGGGVNFDEETFPKKISMQLHRKGNAMTVGIQFK